MRIRNSFIGGLLGALALASTAFAQGAVEVDRRWLDTTVPVGERDRVSTMIGLAPPDFTPGMRFVGDEISLDEYHGKVVVVQFWSRGDRRGIVRLEQLAQLQKDLGEDFVVVGVHVAQQSDGVEQFLERRPLGVPIVIDADGSYASALGVRSNLANLVIDRAGTTRFVLLNPLGIDGAGRELLAEEGPSEGADAPTRTTVAPPTARLPSKKRGSGGFWDERIPDEAFPPAPDDVGQAVNLLGKKGPPIEVEEWLTEAPNAADKVVVVDFWATWCGPCIAGIPHMNRLQQEFADSAVVIGVSNEPAEKVRGWLPGKGMRYSIAVDPSSRIAQVVQNRSIPYAVVYSPDGIVRWQGHPARLTKETLGAIVNASRAP
jgi:thiol-disulfide isomerase/thioredoxin